MKRFIQTYKIARVAMFVVRQDSDAHTFDVLRWAAEDDAPKLLRQFSYQPKDEAIKWTTGAVRMSDANAAAVHYAAEQYEQERESRRQGRLQSNG